MAVALGIFKMVVALVTAAPLVWTVARNHARRKTKHTQVNQNWAIAADELGGSLALPSDSGWKYDSRQLSVLVGELTVIVDHYTVSDLDSKVTYTRLRAASTGPADLHLEVYRAGNFSNLARVVGFQDVPLGVPDFDSDFMVKSNAPDLARLWLHPAVRRSIYSVPDYRFTLDSGEVELLRVGLEDDPDRLAAAVRAAASFADGRQRLREIYQQLARPFDGAQLSSVVGGWLKLELESEGVPITVESKLKRDMRCTVVGGRRLGSAAEAYRLGTDEQLLDGQASVQINGLPGDFFVRTENPELLARRLSPDIIALLDKLVPDELRVAGEELTLWWGGVETDPKKLGAAIALTTQLCQSASQGPYR